MKQINVAKDFTKFPSGRYMRSGNTSGEAFREKFLVPALRSRQEIEIDLDGVLGYGSSFLEEAFGGSVRATKVSPEEFFRVVHLKSSSATLVSEIRQYVKDAGRRLIHG